MIPAVTINDLGFFGFFFAAILFVILSAAAICFVIIPLFRYIFVRTGLFFRYLFSKSKFRIMRPFTFLIPHFLSGKPDFMLLSGKKLYLIKLKSYRKVKSTVTIFDKEHWIIESKRGMDVENDGTILSVFQYIVHKIAVHKRFRRPPNNLVRYAQQVNAAICDEPVDCVPVLLINPTVETVQTSSKIELVDGDTVFYGILMADSFYPGKPEKCSVSGKDARRIFRKARKAMKRLEKPFTFSAPLDLDRAARKEERRLEKEEQERRERMAEEKRMKGLVPQKVDFDDDTKENTEEMKTE